MMEILKDLSPGVLSSANKANQFRFFSHFEQAPLFDFNSHNGITRWSCPHPFFWLNSVLCTRDAVPDDDILVDETLDYYRVRRTNSIGWWLQEGVSRLGWETLLKARGFQLQEKPLRMGVDLEKIPVDISIPPGLEIRQLVEIKDLRTYARIVNTVYGFPSESEAATFDWLMGMGLEMPLLSYLAILDGKPVGTSSVFYGAGAAGIHNVSMLPEARGQGIGAMLTLKPLLEARGMGYRAGVLQASDMGFKVYQRLGFEKTGTLDSYYYEFPEHNLSR